MGVGKSELSLRFFIIWELSEFLLNSMFLTSQEKFAVIIVKPSWVLLSLMYLPQ